jgi:rubredoxin
MLTPRAEREAVMSEDPFLRLMCLGCGFSYDEALELPEHGIAPGTRWKDIPEDWVCPDCGTPKHLFEMVVLGYAEGGAAAAVRA